MKIVTLLDIREEAITQIKTAFAKNTKLHIAAHPGQFNEIEIKRLANQTPAILTSFMRYTEEIHTIDFVSWILYRADNKDRLYDGALKLVSSLIPVIGNLDAAWSIGAGEKIEAECLYSGTLDQINITLWGVKWKWHVRENCFHGDEGGIIMPDDLEYFEGYDAAHHVGSDTAQDNVQLEEAEPINFRRVSNADTI